jgi:hypothetical protein
MSYNIRGLNNPLKVRKLKNYIRISQPPCDILLLQEHKLSGDSLSDLGRLLWPDAAVFSLDAEPGYVLNPNGAGKGGACTLVSPFLEHLYREAPHRPRHPGLQGPAHWLVGGYFIGPPP